MGCQRCIRHACSEIVWCCIKGNKYYGYTRQDLDFHMSFCVFSALWWEVVVCFVDICGIVDHHCLNFLFITNQWKIAWVFNLLWKESLNSGVEQFHPYQQNEQWPFTTNQNCILQTILSSRMATVTKRPNLLHGKIQNVTPQWWFNQNIFQSVAFIKMFCLLYKLDLFWRKILVYIKQSSSAKIHCSCCT